MAYPNAEFWNKQAATYTAADGQRRSYHSEFAAILNPALSGEVLCVGEPYQYWAQRTLALLTRLALELNRIPLVKNGLLRGRTRS